MKRKALLAIALLAIQTFPALAAPAKIEVERQKGCNLFDVGAPVRFNCSVRGLPTGAGEAQATITNLFGEKKTVAVPLQSKAGEATKFVVDLGTPEPGYYELHVTLSLKSQNGKEITGDSTVRVTRQEGPDKKFADTDPISFGVVRLVHRTAEEARAGGYRFGLKVFQIGDPGVWWRRTVVYDLNEIVDATAKLGLQWTRHQFNQGPTTQPGVISTTDLVTKHAMNTVLKVEGFPESCFDVSRYGTIDEWKAKHKGKNWSRCTVPMKAPYQAWLRAEIEKLPVDQNIFEMGNEVWDYLSGEEFAEWCQMSLEVIKQVRPDAKVGADPGARANFTDKFLAAGGMKGMDIIYVHPYCFTPLPEHRVRPLLRNLRDSLRAATGRDLEIWVTEYGWPTAAKDTRGHSVPESVQAQRTVRQSILMYAEDVKALIPHWMADREQDITEREHWFGFFRLSGQPKPVLIAHAVSARMIDGSKFVGDVWVTPGVGAMLFERQGKYTLAVWAAEGEKEAEIDLGVPEVTVVDLMGREKTEKTDAGKIKRVFDTSVVYFNNVIPDLARRATPPGEDLNPDTWSTRSGAFTMRKAGAITIDGKLDEWASDQAIPLAGDAKLGAAEGTLQWDERSVYVAVKVSGNDPAKPGVFKIGLGAKPSRQHTTPSVYDTVLAISPGADGNPTLTLSQNARGDKPVSVPQQSDASKIRWALQPGAEGWTGEIAIPIALLNGFPDPKPGARISLRLSFEKDKRTLSTGPELTRLWAYLTLAD